ncbi:MAG: hypothetical protein ACOY3P_16590 [Planctomycetota bacterium]
MPLIHRLAAIPLLSALVACALGSFCCVVQAQVRVGGEAVAGEPFGVGRIDFVLPNELIPVPLGPDGLGLREAGGRVLYPVLYSPQGAAIARELIDQAPILRRGPIRNQIRGLVGELLDQPGQRSIYFLFRGKQPLQLSLQAADDLPLTLPVRVHSPRHGELLREWWDYYTSPPGLFESEPDYPPIVENYLKATLGRRLGLKLPEREQETSPAELLNKEVGLLLGEESIRMALQQDRVLGLHHYGEVADQPLPEPPALPPLEFPPGSEKVDVEPLALRVPVECFYVRFGSFSNFLWLQDTVARFNGDLQNLLATRGVNYNTNKRIEQQLGLRQSALARLFGDAVIDDVAIIGTDMLFRDTASYGLLFRARNNFAVSADFSRQRTERANDESVREQIVTIGDRQISYLYSRDGSVRSYYVADGEYHFFTTSRTLARRFLETGQGGTSLGESPDFRHARTLVPLSRDDTIFVYFSDAFFQNLSSPGYRIELIRRLQAATDISTVQLAVLAAASEGRPGGSIESLVRGGLLPPNFGPLPDGSHVALRGGEVYDVIRGWPGGFLPVADMTATTATPAEVREYRRFIEFYRTHWGRMDPTIVAIRRRAVERNHEQVAIDMQLSPFAAQHFELLSKWAGPADNVRVSPVRGDIARAELLLPDQRVFVGLRDIGIAPELAATRALPIGRLRELLVGYLGTTGQGGLLGFLDQPILFRDRPDGPQMRLGIAHMQTPQFRLYSLQPEVLAEVAPQLHLQPAPRPAQLRLSVGDLTSSRMSGFANSFAYGRTVDTTLGNLRLLHAMDQQLHVPPREARNAAEYIIAGQLVCPLGGKYEFLEETDGEGRWTSTALTGKARGGIVSPPAPDAYAAPLLSWLRGLELEATMTEKVLWAHADVMMEMPADPRARPSAE